MRQAGLPDEYVSAVPFLPRPDTPTKEHNSGDLWSSSPVFGLVRVRMGPNGDGGTLCLGDSVVYETDDGVRRYGRAISLMVSEAHEGLAVRLRRYMTTEEVTAVGAGVEGWEPPPPPEQLGDGNRGVALGYWETMWLHVVPVTAIKGVVAAHAVPAVDHRSAAGTQGEVAGDVCLLGTVTEYGKWAVPYERPLLCSEEPWMALGGRRTSAVSSLVAAAHQKFPFTNLSIVFWTDSFQTYTRGTVSGGSLSSYGDSL